MEDSSMDMTAVCSTEDGPKSDNAFKESNELLHQENYELKNKFQILERAYKELENEMLNVKMGSLGRTDSDLSVSLDVSSSKAIFQENHELKKKIEILEKINLEMESDIVHLTHMKARETTKLLNVQEELEVANSKIKFLESSLEEERGQITRLIQEAKETKGSAPENNVVVLPDQEQLNILTLHIEKLENQREEDQQLMKVLLGEKAALMENVNTLKSEIKCLQNELSEIKEHLDQKTTDLRNVNTALEGLREDKLILNAEIQLLKASDSNAARGNSLFAEVEENRQKVAAQRELLKLKYFNLKKIYNQKLAENNKLKLEIVKIRRDEKEDEKSVHHDYTNLIETYKQKVWELEERVKELVQKTSQPPILLSESNNSQWMWVNTVVEDARKETRRLQEELDKRGSNYVTQGHQLLASQRENRKLKATVAKLQSDIDVLRLKEELKSGQENAQDQDGISPPATEVAIEYQKQKMVRFKEALREQSNTSKNNTSSSDPDTSLGEQNKSLKETNSLLTKVKEENKENLN